MWPSMENRGAGAGTGTGPVRGVDTTFFGRHYFNNFGCPLHALSAWSGPTRKFILIKTEVMNGHFMAHVFRASTRGTGSGGMTRKSRLITQVMTRMGRALFSLSHRVRSGNEVPRL